MSIGYPVKSTLCRYNSFLSATLQLKALTLNCCVKSPPGFEPGTYSKKGLKEKLLFQLSYDDIFVAVSVKSGYDNSYFPAATARKLAGWDSNPRTGWNRFTVGCLVSSKNITHTVAICTDTLSVDIDLAVFEID